MGGAAARGELAVGIILSVCKHGSYELGTTFQPQKTIDSAIAGIR